MNALGHETVVKRLFKHAEERDDDELMAAFAVAFDRLVRRMRKTKYHYDWQTRASWQEERLVSPRNTLPHVGQQRRFGIKPATGRRIESAARAARNGAAVHATTRATTCAAARGGISGARGIRSRRSTAPPVALMLRRYTDGMLASGESLLDSWSLMHACFRESDVLRIRRVEGQRAGGPLLAELEAAPDFPELWSAETRRGCSSSLLTGAVAGRARLGDAVAAARPRGALCRLFGRGDSCRCSTTTTSEVQQFAAEMLETIDHAGEARPRDVAEAPADAQPRRAGDHRPADGAARHAGPADAGADGRAGQRRAGPGRAARACVPPDAADRIRGGAGDDLAARERALRRRRRGDHDVGAVDPRARASITTSTPSRASSTACSQTARDAAWAWLIAADSAGYHDPALWSRLIETPYDDLRFHVVARARAPRDAARHVASSRSPSSGRRCSSASTAAGGRSSRRCGRSAGRSPTIPRAPSRCCRCWRSRSARCGCRKCGRAGRASSPRSRCIRRSPTRSRNIFPELQLSAEAAV